MLRSITAVGVAALLCVGCAGGGGDESDEGVPNARNASVSTSSTSISRSATADQSVVDDGLVQITTSNTPETLYVGVDHGSTAIDHVDIYETGATTGELRVTFRSPQALGAGEYHDTVTVRLCYDIACAEHLRGSPFMVSTTLTVTPVVPQPEPGIEPLPTSQRGALGHDVIDAEYSAALDAIVLVSSYPDSALYVLNPVTRGEQKVALNKVPAAVSVSPDGRSAAVGHDALVTVVDLTTAGLASPGKVLLNTTIDVLDVVLTGNGYVHAFPRRDQWEEIHSIQIATNIETLSSGGLIYAGTLAKLHPSGTKMYGANNGLSPSDIERYGVRTGTATYDYDSPYHGDYEMCGNLWMHETGLHIYTACGNVFKASDVRAQDMTYTGHLQLSTSEYYGFRIVSLSHSSETKNIVLLEEDAYACGPYQTGEQCYTRVGYYESDFLNLTARYSMAPVTVSGQVYRERGLFAFHNAAGSTRYLISRLVGMPNPTAEYYLSNLP
ncbi:MAG: hypothetical protein Q8Q73_02000 [Stagnimonas sp.]|nr:hypothetical protein [Stagnimonas sp.]